MGLPSLAHIGPAGVDPIALHGQIVAVPPGDFFEVPFGVHPRAPVGIGKQPGERFSAGRGRIIVEEKPPPQIMGAQAALLPEQHYDARGANVFSRHQLGAYGFRAGLEREFVWGRLFEAGLPRSAPSQREQNAAIGGFDVEEGHGFDGREAAAVASSAVRVEGETPAGSKCVRQRCEIGVGAVAAPRMVYDGGRSGADWHAHVKRAHVFENGRIGRNVRTIQPVDAG